MLLTFINKSSILLGFIFNIFIDVSLLFVALSVTNIDLEFITTTVKLFTTLIISVISIFRLYFLVKEKFNGKDKHR